MNLRHLASLNIAILNFFFFFWSYSQSKLSKNQDVGSIEFWSLISQFSN